jgi:DMSO/TMAO reductase YedYZ molybdopterin-dependent catalytic subunit
VGLGLVAAGTGCAPAVTTTPGPQPGGEPTPTTGRGWTWNIRSIDGVPAVDRASWRLRVDGLVAGPQTLAMSDLKLLPVTEQRSRMKCVECWSAPAVWRGISGKDLMASIGPSPAGSHLRMYAIDGYDTTVPMNVILASRTLFVYGMDGGDLPPEHGAPLRLIVPSMYGYKNCKNIVRLEVTSRSTLGYWERAGYSDDGTIQIGTDHPLDLNDFRPILGGEITDY